MTVAGQNVVIRELQTFQELSSVQAVEKEVWSMAGDDAMPLTLAIACKAAGNLFLGAFDGVKMVGFAFGFFGREHERVILHSHMVGVLAPYQHLNLGYRLKLAQREWALARQVGEITWTYDPLQSRNAHFNFAKLGIVSDTYKVDFYGPETSSILHRNGTDRLWGRWVLNARRVRDHASDSKLAALKECLDKAEFKELTDGRGADVIYDPVGGEVLETGRPVSEFLKSLRGA